MRRCDTRCECVSGRKQPNYFYHFFFVLMIQPSFAPQSFGGIDAKISSLGTFGDTSNMTSRAISGTIVELLSGSFVTGVVCIFTTSFSIRFFSTGQGHRTSFCRPLIGALAVQKRGKRGGGLIMRPLLLRLQPCRWVPTGARLTRYPSRPTGNDLSISLFLPLLCRTEWPTPGEHWGQPEMWNFTYVTMTIPATPPAEAIDARGRRHRQA